MKLGVYSHCAIDTIILNNSSYEQVGGAACYAGLTARQFKFDVNLFTKFGSDFPHEQYLLANKIKYENALSQKNTTRFKIMISGPDRTLYLENECEPLDNLQVDADGVIISPIYHELNSEALDLLKNDSSFTFLDPQGFLRRTNSDNQVILEKTDLDLTDISAIKVNPDEITNLVGDDSVESMKLLQKKGIKYVLLTNKQHVSLLVDDRMYSITLPNKELYDTTGIGDIFSATFCCTMLKEKDFLWALCFAGGAAQAALDSKSVGLDKIPKKGKIETNASYFYNLVKFQQV